MPVASRSRRATRELRLAPNLGLPLDAVTRTFGIFGQRGTGKSTTGAVLVEQMVGAGGRVVVGDPTGVWWGLTHEGTGPGLPGIIFGGEHADVPLEKSGGHVVAEFVVGQDEYPLVVLDLSLLRKGARATFMADFLESLYHLNREALHVVLDEAHTLAPQSPREKGDLIRCLGAVEDVVALGRSHGLGGTVISQRLATLNANVREQVGTLVAHQLVGPLDQKALKGWIQAQGDAAQEKIVLEQVANREVGEALVWSPGFGILGVVQVDPATTFDSRATPEVGERRKQPGARADVDLAVLRERMAATIEEAESKDPKALRARVALLERQLAEAEPRIIEVPVVTDEQITAVQFIVRELRDYEQDVGLRHTELRELLNPLSINMKDALQSRDFPPRPADLPRLSATSRRQPEPQLRPAPGAAAESGASGGASTSGELPTAARHYLETLARHHPMEVTIAQLGLLARRKPRGGSFNTAMKALRQRELIVESGGLVRLSEAGLAEAGVEPRPLTSAEIIEQWRSALPTAALAVFDVLLEAHPGVLLAPEVARRAGREPRGGSWNTAVKVLVQNGLIHKEGDRMIADDALFPDRSKQVA